MSYLKDNSQVLFRELSWPSNLTPTNVYSDGILKLKKSIKYLLDQQYSNLQILHHEEKKVLETIPTAVTHFKRLKEIQSNIISFGEIPNLFATNDIFNSLAQNILSKNDLKEFKELGLYAKDIPTISQTTLQVLNRISSLEIELPLKTTALKLGINENWASLLWTLLSESLSTGLPYWWDEISTLIRDAVNHNSVIKPKIVINRLLITLKTKIPQNEPLQDKIKEIVKTIERIRHRWVQLEPNPPNSDLRYNEIKTVLVEIRELFPDLLSDISTIIDQGDTIIDQVLKYWSIKDFGNTQIALRQALLRQF
jgi:hypothetical protein